MCDVFCAIDFQAYDHPTVALKCGTELNHCNVIKIEATTEEDAKKKLPKGYILYRKIN